MNYTDYASNLFHEEKPFDVNSSPVGMALVGLDGRCREVDHSFCHFFGYSAQELFQFPVAS
jgi:PAS domain S-box-containing protein